MGSDIKDYWGNWSLNKTIFIRIVYWNRILEKVNGKIRENYSIEIILNSPVC